MSQEQLLAGVGATLGIVGLSSIPAVTRLFTRTGRRGYKQETYEDGDGRSTPEALKAFSMKPAKTILLLLSLIGSGVSIAISVLSTLHISRDGLFLENWLSTAAWILLVFQIIVIASTRHSVAAYQLGLFAFVSSFVLFVATLVQDTRTFAYLLDESEAAFALRIVQLVAALALGIASLSIPRRPDVFNKDGKQIDRMYTVSAWSRYNFGWPIGLLKYASKKKDLELSDLPRPGQDIRASDVSRDWHNRNYPHSLWLSLVLAHKWTFAAQWFLVLVGSVLNFAPQWVILQILRILETRTTGASYGADVWMWVIWLGLSIIANSWVEGYTFWLAWAGLSIPVRSQLSALIFEKAMRRKDVKGTGKSKKTKSGPESPESVTASAAASTTSQDNPDEEPAEDDADAVLKSKQSTVNLIGVDAKRISDFCTFQQFFPGSIFKLVVSLGFLVSLLGWKALLAGFASMVAIMPINIYFSKRYSNAQDRLMKLRDEKLEVVNEALQGIRQIKFSALEPDWEKKVGAVRDRELKAVESAFRNDTMLIACWVTSPIMLSAVALAVYAAIHGDLTPSVAFVSLGVFKALEITLSVIPELTTDLLDAWISLKRIDSYLKSAEVSSVAKDADEVRFDNATIAWPEEDSDVPEDGRFVLKDLNLSFPKGELSVISGRTGSGKSLILSAILGEIDLLRGDLYVPHAPAAKDRRDDKATKANWIIPSSIAYVAQIPWIENASITDNITFGLPYDEERYHKTIEVCALKKDLEMLSDGASTEIGANGINLSGGQKWRVTLARAIYSRAGILVLDDIFSAVDAHVGRHIFEKCLNGELSVGRTRILVTHHVGLVESKTKYLVELGDGKVLNSGFLSDLREEGTLEQIKSHEQGADEIHAGESGVSTAAFNSDESSTGDEEDEQPGNTLRKVTSKKDEPRKFVEEEAKERGAIRKHVYATYLQDSGGWVFWTVALLLFIGVQALTLGRSWWLRLWTGDYEEESVNAFGVNETNEHAYTYVYSLQHSAFHPTSNPTAQSSGNLRYYLGIYVGLALISSALGTIKYYYIYMGSVRASRSLFQKLNFNILHAPLRWLDTVPVGRILNRFTADFHVVDSQLAYAVSFGAGSFLQLIGVVVAGLFVSPWIVLLSFLLLLSCLHFSMRYLDGARPVKRIESNMKSPVFEQFGSALAGVASIRGFDKTSTYIDRMYLRLDDWATSTWHLWLFNRWLGWRMALIGSTFSVFVTVFILSTPSIDAALAGFALAFSLDFAQCVIMTIRLYSNLELQMNAAERIIEYTELPTEPLGGEKAPAAWPTDGRIEVNDLVVSYADDLPPVLKGLTFDVNRKERIGVIGRTGAGKSSLTLALFRFLEAKSGSVHIDGVDISKISLHDLRSRLAIIPQDPVLFSGTVRSNLDPFDNYTDAELRECLERVHLVTAMGDEAAAAHGNTGEGSSATATPSLSDSENSTTSSAQNTNLFADLSSPISEGGLNLSQGQRQLLCLARAIVSRPRVMVLDEATSAVDMATDALIQHSIRREFTESTLLVIAHRLSTIADFDRILVLSDGRVAEFGSPRELWERGDDNGATLPEGQEAIFRHMCEESGETERLRAIVYGKMNKEKELE